MFLLDNSSEGNETDLRELISKLKKISCYKLIIEENEDYVSDLLEASDKE